MSSTKLVPLALIASLVFTAAALAGNPHFVRPNASGPDTSGSLTVTFKMATLGHFVTTVVEASADSTAVYACQSPGGGFPGHNNRQEVSEPVSESGEFTSERNGQVTGQLFLNPPPSTLDCQAGLTRVLASVTYTNAQVCSDLGECASIPGAFRRTFFDVGSP
jgi:hypothetical protein